MIGRLPISDSRAQSLSLRLIFIPFVQFKRIVSNAGTLRTEGKTFALEGKVRGEDITFKAGGREYRGRMNGKQLKLR